MEGERKGEGGGFVTGTNIVKPQRALIKHYVGPNVSHRDDSCFRFRYYLQPVSLSVSIVSFNKSAIVIILYLCLINLK